MNKTYLFLGASSKIAIESTNILRQEGDKVIGISRKPDITGYDQWYQIDQYDEAFYPDIEAPIDGLVYFPGSINLKPFNRLSKQDFINDFQINTLGAVAFVQKYLSNIKKSDTASVVFMSSVAAQVGMPYHTSISMAKAALEGLTRSLAAELAPAIRVNAVAPSLTNTILSEKFLSTPEKVENAEKRNPMKKVGSPAEVAACISFLLSEKAGWVTGQVLAVDGGMVNLKL